MPKSQHVIVLRTLLSVVITMFLVTPPVFAQNASGSRPMIPVANFTGFSDASLSEYLTDNLKPEIQQVIRERRLVVVATAWTWQLQGGKACFATIGLAEAPPKGRNPRWPSFTSRSFEFGASDDCLAAQIRGAVTTFNENPLEKVLSDIDLTSNAGGVRQTEAANRDRVQFGWQSDNEYNNAPIFDKLQAYSVGEALDYRHVTTFVRSNVTRFDSGKLMCVAEAGFTARKPEGRNSRVPASLNASIVLQDGGGQPIASRTQPCLRLIGL